MLNLLIKKGEAIAPGTKLKTKQQTVDYNLR